MENYLFISLWGNPEKWYNAKYVFGDENPNESITSSRVIEENIKPEKSIIFIPDSIYPELLGDGNLSNYSHEIIGNIYEKIKEKDIKSSEFFEKSEKIVFPLKISFSSDNKNYEFDIGIDNLYVFFYKALLKRLIEYNLNDIAVDITHGINFIQFIFLESLEYAINAYSIITRKKINVFYYNSDPYSNSLMHIYKVKSISVENRNVLPVASREFYNAYRNNKNKIKNFLKNDDAVDYLKACSAMIQSVTVPYLIHIIHKILNVLPEYNNYGIELSIDSNGNDIKICQKLNENICINIETVYFIDIIKAIGNYISSDALTINKIYEITDIYFGRESDNAFIKKGLSSIKSKIKTRYPFSIANFSRNFRAHAGLLYEICRIENDQIKYVTYNYQNIKIDDKWIIDQLIK